MNNFTAYVKCTGVNRYAGGSFNWLKIRKFEVTKKEYVIHAKVRGYMKQVGIRKGLPVENLVFAICSKGNHPRKHYNCGISAVVEHFKA